MHKRNSLVADGHKYAPEVESLVLVDSRASFWIANGRW